MRTFIVAVVSAAVFCLLGAQRAAQAEPIYSVAVEDIDLSPYSKSEGGVYSGFARELLDRFAKSQGIAFEYRPMPLRRLIIEFLEGGHDFKFPDNPGWRSDLRGAKQILYSDPIVRYTDGVIVRPHLAGGSLSQLRSLSMLRGFTTLPGMDKAAAMTFNHADMASMLRFALSGRVDAVFGTLESLRHHLAATPNGANYFVLDRSLPLRQDYYRLSTLKYPDVVTRLNAWMTTHEGDVSSVKRRWGLDDDRPDVTAQFIQR